MYVSSPPVLGIVFLILILIFGFAGWMRPKSEGWKFVDILYYLLSGAGVILLALSTQREATIAIINNQISKAQIASDRANNEPVLTAADAAELDNRTARTLSDAATMIPKSICDDPKVLEEPPSPLRNRPTACGLRDGLQFSVERILGITKIGDPLPLAFAKNGEKRCRAIIEINKEINGTRTAEIAYAINGLVLNYPQDLERVAELCKQHPAIVAADREGAHKRVLDLQKESQNDSGISDDPFWVAVRSSLWPYFLLVGLGLKFGKAVAAVS